MPWPCLRHVGVGLLFATVFGGEGRAAEPVFLKPNPAAVFPEHKVYDPAGSPFRVPLEDWAGARRRVSEDPQWRAWLQKQRADTDDWMANRRDRVEWVAGWWHDFVSPKDGSFLTWTPEEPGEAGLSSPSDPKVPLTPKIKGGWVFVFRARHAEKMLEAARLYRLTQDERYAGWAADQLDFYAANFEKWPLQQRGSVKSRLSWQSLDEAVNLVRHANTARLLADYATAARKRTWREKLFAPQCAMLNESFQFIHNIACWHRAAVGCVAALYQDDPFWKQAVDSPFGIRQQMLRGVTSDYFWYEQSMTYNAYVARALLPFFEFAALTGRAGELKEELCILENLMLAPISIRFPNGQVPNPADSTGGLPHAPNRSLLASAYRIYPTAIGLAEAASSRTWDTLLDPPSPPPSGFKLSDVVSQNLESSRMAVLRQGSWQVFFHYGQLNASHAQREALNFEAFLGATDVTHDPGTVGYGSPLHREFYTQGLAHNVPLVNGAGQEGWNQGELIAFDPARGLVAARQPNYRRDASAERRLRIDGKQLTDSVTITLKTNAVARLGLALHLQGKVELPATFAPYDSLTGNSSLPAFKYWQDARRATGRDQAKFLVRLGDRTLQLTVGVPGEFSMIHASTPDVPPHRRESLYIERRGTNAVFTTTFEPAD